MEIFREWTIPPRTDVEYMFWKLYIAMYDEINAINPVGVITAWIRIYGIDDPDVRRAINIFIMRSNPNYCTI
jgi:hypothetical protein